MSTGRVETFADGVLAIAATLLILNVDSQIRETDHLARELLQIWPSYVAYAVSFLTIGIIWANHHTFMHQIERADRTFLLLTVLFLLCISFIPFPTRLVAEHIRDDGARAATVLYGITLTLTAVMFNAVWLYASVRRRLLKEDADPKVVAGITRSYRWGPVSYLVVTIVALIHPILGVALLGLVDLSWVIDSAVFAPRERATSGP
jgi:uncharacterized membrane protein